MKFMFREVPNFFKKEVKDLCNILIEKNILFVWQYEPPYILNDNYIYNIFMSHACVDFEYDEYNSTIEICIYKGNLKTGYERHLCYESYEDFIKSDGLTFLFSQQERS